MHLQRFQKKYRFTPKLMEKYINRVSFSEKNVTKIDLFAENV